MQTRTYTTNPFEECQCDGSYPNLITKDIFRTSLKIKQPRIHGSFEKQLWFFCLFIWKVSNSISVAKALVYVPLVYLSVWCEDVYCPNYLLFCNHLIIHRCNLSFTPGAFDLLLVHVVYQNAIRYDHLFSKMKTCSSCYEQIFVNFRYLLSWYIFTVHLLHDRHTRVPLVIQSVECIIIFLNVWNSSREIDTAPHSQFFFSPV